MTTYKALKGKKVKFFTSEPPGAVAEGQVWYNSGNKEYKTSVFVSAWASGGNLVSGRRNPVTFGIQTAAVVAGGHTPAGDFSTSESGCQILFWKISTPLKSTL